MARQSLVLESLVLFVEVKSSPMRVRIVKPHVVLNVLALLHDFCHVALLRLILRDALSRQIRLFSRNDLLFLPISGLCAYLVKVFVKYLDLRVREVNLLELLDVILDVLDESPSSSESTASWSQSPGKPPNNGR